MSQVQPPAPPPPDGRVTGWLTAVKGLTLTNAAVIVLLVIVAAPAYVVYRAVNDQGLLDRFLSTYKEISGPHVECAVREARARGGPGMWSISTGFAYSGADRWTVSVVLDHPPDNEELHSYCTALGLIVDFMRDPHAQSPTFPNNADEPIVRQYPRQKDEP